MSSSKTEHYQLHQWEPQDSVLREEFNANFAALDGAARVVTGSYTGDGTIGRFIDLGFTPAAVLSMRDIGTTYSGGDTYGGLAFPGQPLRSSMTVALEIVEGGFKVSYRPHDDSYVNFQGSPYFYLAMR